MKLANDAVTVRLIKPSQLTTDEIAAWNTWRLQSQSLQSPYFHPSFFQAVATVRDDTEIAVIEEGGALAGFFPFQRNRLNFGRPVGGRLSDFHGLILKPDFTCSSQMLLKSCGLAAWDFTHLPADQSVFEATSHTLEPSPFIDITQGFESYVEERRAAGSKTIVRTQRKSRKLEREIGPLRFESHVADDALLRTLMEWKTQQYRRTGVQDVFAFPWTVSLLQHILDCQTPSFSGRLSAMYAGDQLIAAHFGMQTESVLHYWFPVYDTEYEKYSPGLVLLLEIVADADARKISRIDLGKGLETYKHSLKSGSFDVATGSCERDSVFGNARRCWRETRNWLKVSRWGAPVRASAKLVRPLREWLSFR